MAEPSEGDGRDPRVFRDHEGREYRATGPLKRGADGLERVPVEVVGDTQGVHPGPCHLLIPVDERGRRIVADLYDVSVGTDVPPCPRPVGRIVPPGEGLIVQTAEESLADWWNENLSEPSALPMLFEVLAELCQRIGDFRDFSWEQTPCDPTIDWQSIRRIVGEPWRIHNLTRVSVELPDITEGLAEGWDWPPEILFRARRAVPSAADSWGVGELLLRMLRYRERVQRGESEEPIGFLDPVLRSHRCRLVEDLFLRKPKLFFNKPIRPNDFLYPDALPVPDAQALRDALEGGPESIPKAESLEFLEPLQSLLTRAMAIAPEERFLDVRELGSDLRGIAVEYRVRLSRVRRRAPVSEVDSQIETRLFADVLPEAREPVDPELVVGLQVSVDELRKRLQGFEAQLALQAKRLKLQEKNLEVVTGMETSAYSPPASPVPMGRPSDMRRLVWGLWAVSVVLVVLMGGFLWSKIGVVEGGGSQASAVEGVEPSEEPAGSSQVGVETNLPSEVSTESKPVEAPARDRSETVELPQGPARASGGAQSQDREAKQSNASPGDSQVPVDVEASFAQCCGYLVDSAGQKFLLPATVPAGAYRAWWASTGTEPIQYSSQIVLGSRPVVTIRCGMGMCKVR